MPCSAAIFRTSGELRDRRRSSRELDAGARAMAAALDGCEAPAGCAVDSVFGGGPPAATPDFVRALPSPTLPAAGAGALPPATAAPFSVSSRATTVCTGTV